MKGRCEIYTDDASKTHGLCYMCLNYSSALWHMCPASSHKVERHECVTSYYATGGIQFYCKSFEAKVKCNS